jgi:arabinose-5-phosphate isomerase
MNKVESSKATASKSLPQCRTSFFDQVAAVLKDEAAAIFYLSSHVPPAAYDLALAMAGCRGTIIFSGIGKSGHVARKVAATFCSLGRSALFLDPVSAVHGDLGVVQPHDMVIAFSKSGSTRELEPFFVALAQCPVTVALVSCSAGRLASLCNLSVVLPFEREACPLGLAPTSSSTLMLAFGDALAVALSQDAGFTADDFGRLHPSGMLGDALHRRVSEFMYGCDELALLAPQDSFEHVAQVMSEKTFGSALVMSSDKKLVGIVTDGDVRRACLLGPDVFTMSASDIMTCSPRRIARDAKAADALLCMQEHSITSLVVEHEGVLCGLVHIHDIVRAGITF